MYPSQDHRVSVRRSPPRATLPLACLAAALSASAALTGAEALAQDAQPQIMAPMTPGDCAALAEAQLPNTRIVEATAMPASESPKQPAHCKVVGAINERTGSDGKLYAIGFNLLMAEDWNGRFLFQGGGGVDGVIRRAEGTFGPEREDDNPLSHGYAVATTDSGHKIERNIPVVGAVTFGLEQTARVEYGYEALEMITPIIKEIIADHYGAAPRHSYFIGCSNGGRQAFQASQRFPEMFDGVVAGAPGFNAPDAVVNQMWYLKAWAEAATEKDAEGYPYLATALTAAEQQTVADAVLERCDARDGLVDGVVDDVPGCDFDPAVLQCTGEKTDQCLRPEQVTALEKMFAGPTDSSGKRLAVDWPWDAGISAPGWRDRPLGFPSEEKINNASALYLGGAAQAYLFSTPPKTPGLEEAKAGNAAGARAAMQDYVFNYDFDTEPAALRATNDEFPESPVSWDVADKTDLSAFKDLGHKMIVYHGGSDPSWSLNDTMRWYKGVEEKDPAVRDFARLFIVPGLNHCTGGPAMEKADFLTPLVEWVEHGKAPERIVGEALEAEDVPWPGRTRPFCVYPEQARYTGVGSIEMAENFVCERP